MNKSTSKTKIRFNTWSINDKLEFLEKLSSHQIDKMLNAEECEIITIINESEDK